jgi:hypothetical protein
MFNKLIKYIITLLFSIIIFCVIPEEMKPIKNIFIFVLLFLLIVYFIDNCGVSEYFTDSNANANTVVDPNANANPVVDPNANPVANANANPVANANANPVANANDNPVVDPNANPVANTNANPVVDPNANGNPVVDPNANANTGPNPNNYDINNNLYIKKKFLPLCEKILLIILSYDKLPNNLETKIKAIINLINNNENNNIILNKIKEIDNDINSVLIDKQIITDKVAKTYLLMAKDILKVIIKNYKLIILQEQIDFKSDILQLNKDLEITMKTNLGKILKLNISIEINSLDESDIKTFLQVEFNPSIENIVGYDSSNTQISEMLKQLANKLETDNNECNCEKKVNEAINKYLKNGKYIDDNGIIKNIINSDMIYNQLDTTMLQSLGSHDNSFSNKWDKGYTYLNTTKWSVPKVSIPQPPNINNIHSSLTPGYPINVLEFDNSRKVLGPDSINLQYIKDKLN